LHSTSNIREVFPGFPEQDLLGYFCGKFLLCDRQLEFNPGWDDGQQGDAGCDEEGTSRIDPLLELGADPRRGQGDQIQAALNDAGEDAQHTPGNDL
jgi:hypothetical protein